MVLSSVMADVHSDIRGETYYRALELEKQGQKVLKLNTGNPATFGFRMPESVRRCIEENAEKALGYCDVRGMAAAREAIRDYHLGRGIHGVETDDVFIGNGVSEIAAMLTTVSLNEGDEVLVPMPCYSLWVNQIVMVKAKPVFYRCDEQADWCPDMADMRRRVTAKTRAILLINPNNPTGAVYGDTLLHEVIQLAREHSLMIWSDEIYDRLIVDGTYTSIASLCDDVPIITMNGLSKSHCLCGLRCGWLVLSGPRAETAPINRALTTLASVRLCSNALMQLIVPTALADTAYTNAMLHGRLASQREATCKAFDRIEGASYVANKAAFYLFPRVELTRYGFDSDKQFAAALLEKEHILIVPGSGFYWDKPDHFRIVMLPEAEELAHAIDRIGAFLQTR